LLEIIISRCKKIVEFSCRDNYLTDIDLILTNNIHLGAFYISNNNFPHLDVQKIFHLKELQKLIIIIGIHLPNDIKYEIW